MNRVDRSLTNGIKKVCPACEPTWERCKGVFVILCVIAVFVFLYWIFLMLRHRTTNITPYDTLNREVIRTSYMRPLSSWPLSHFILFFILGFLYPSCYVLILSLGIVWEGVEVLLSKVFRRSYQGVRSDTGLEYQDNYWAGSFRDIVMNFAGFGLGYAFRSWMEGIKEIQERQGTNR